MMIHQKILGSVSRIYSEVIWLKVEREPSPLLYPCPVVLVACAAQDGKRNIITLAWVGVACSEPPIIGIAVRPSRFSYGLIQKSGEFTVNIPTVKMLSEVDFCGTFSGLDVDKFSRTKLTPAPAKRVRAPIIEECPVNLECVLKDVEKLGSHDLFLGEVVATHVDGDLLNEKGEIDYTRTKPFVYVQGQYWSLQKPIARGGFSKEKGA